MTDLRDWIHERVAAEENLTRPQLVELVTALGRERRFWAEWVRHDPETRYFRQLYRDGNLDIWLICWLETQDTGYHDHELSSGAVLVTEGILCEDYFYRDADGWIHERTNEWSPGQVFHFDGSSIHGVRHPDGAPPATSLHAYSPSLWRMGHYEPGEGGLRRTSITYADELVGAEPLPGPEPDAGSRSLTPARG